MTTITGHTTRASGTILTATIYNFDHVNHVTNAQNLNAVKLEGATPPVVDGHVVVFSGTSGAAIRTSGAAPVVANAALFNAIKQDATQAATGVLRQATDAEVRSAAPVNAAITPGSIESAAALVTLTDAATIAVDWDSFINGIVTLGGNRTLGAPTNLQFGTWRTLWIQGNDATARTLSFSGTYLGSGVTPITGITSSARYLLSMFALNSTNAVLLYPKSPVF